MFPEVTAIPGETVHFFAARRAGMLASGADELLARLHARHLETSYVSEYFIPFRMTPDRMADLEAQMRPAAGTTPVNRDFAPVAYYFDVALWSSQFNQGYRRLFRAMAGVDFGTVAGALDGAGVRCWRRFGVRFRPTRTCPHECGHGTRQCVRHGAYGRLLRRRPRGSP